ncbi:MAG: glycosyltransferase family 4 protein [Caldilineaceae bacterium]|nr:glycosyltransferase family 4 protein [Caldilineaceae bacterium]
MQPYHIFTHKSTVQDSSTLSNLQPPTAYHPPRLPSADGKETVVVDRNGYNLAPNRRAFADRSHPRRIAPAPQTLRRIAFVVHKFPPESLGGTELYCWSLARTLAQAGHEIHIFYPTPQLLPGEEKVEREGVHLWRVPLPDSRLYENPVSQYWHTFRDLSMEAAFQRFLAEVDPQLVHFQHVQGVSARLIELAAPRTHIVTLHDYWFFCANSQLIRPDHRPCDGPSAGCRNCVDCATERADLQWMKSLRPLVALPFAYRNHYLRKLADEVDLFIAPSDFLRDQYIRHGFPADRIVVIENGLDESKLTLSALPPLPEPSARPHFGFLGSLAWQKGVHILIEAFNQVDEDASLTIYGSERLFPDYVAQLKALARHPHIRFAGLLPPQQVGAALRQMDCLVVPSLWYENSPLVIQEAYGVGVPVVASRLGAMPEKVQDGRAGRLFEAGNVADLTGVLRDLVAHPHALAQMAEQIVPAPGMAEHADHLLSIYEGLIEGRK